MNTKIEFIEKPGYGRAELQRVQLRLFNMAVAIKNVLDAKRIPYMLAYGSLLGAVRHRGFIPWDDDFDFNLFDDTYDEAVLALKENLPSDLFVEDAQTEPRYFHGWAHVKDLRSVTYCSKWAQDNAYAHKGVHIDLYRIKRMKGFEVTEYLQEENLAYLERRRRHGLINEVEFACRNIAAEKCTFVPEALKEVDGYAMINIYKCKFMPGEMVLPLSHYEFNGVSFPGPYCADGVLTYLYGDYSKLPPLEKRTPSFDAVEFI